MCGINGFTWHDPALARRMNRAIRHRGPDGQGIYADDWVTLGHVRLAIIDLTVAGSQPMHYSRKDGASNSRFRKARIAESEYAIVFNGEIYNYREVREKLLGLGRTFKGDSDTEVLLAAYDEWGPGSLSHLNGMFAFAIYDLKAKTLFLARDRFGIKPLYYITTQKGFAFSSEINALRLLIAAPEIDPDGLRQFFTFRFTIGEKTMLKGVKKLLPGHWMLVDLESGELKTRRWYSLKGRSYGLRPFSWWKNGLRRRLDRAVERRMVADVPVSSFLSGGIDSSVITLLAKRRNPLLNTFSMGFETTNELPYARLVAESVGTRHHELLLDERKLLSSLEQMVLHMDEPIGDPGFLPVFVLSEEVAKHNKVVLSGDGGDEVLTGYDRYKLLHYGWSLRHLTFSALGSDILSRLKAMRGKDSYGAFLEIIRLFDAEELCALGVEEWDAHAYWDTTFGNSRVERAQGFDIGTLLPGDFFMKADKMSSAWGLEQRVPFLDHELVEFAFSMPLKYKLKFWNEKKVLKETFKKDLPKKITKRHKHGFNVPIDHWFKTTLGKRLQQLLKESKHNLYNKAYVYELLEEIKNKGSNYKENFVIAQKLWSILVFEEWYALVFERRKNT